MGLSIADIERWRSRVHQCGRREQAARADAATQASSQLKGLSAFNHWQGDGAAAAQASTRCSQLVWIDTARLRPRSPRRPIPRPMRFGRSRINSTR